ncbi:hypothetical protein BDY21DRAFT_370267 [Lineolata rhizophorae]|uniref:Uncharacterized protein n=1 Tax=Lineolata rhizophorae TaxID=578093 RepID=A0A6A6P6D5_9PEZI|nr:hypothetical protein BDY21DRAFT_370267 [Lineolata rhizophorae]
MSTSSMAAAMASTKQQPPDTAFNPAVSRMLRTSMDTGDLFPGGASSRGSGGPQRRSGSRPGSAHSHYSRPDTAMSRREHHHHHQSKPSTASSKPKSVKNNKNVPQYIADTASPTLVDGLPLNSLIPQAASRNSGRSFSLTDAAVQYSAHHPAFADAAFARPASGQRPRGPPMFDPGRPPSASTHHLRYVPRNERMRPRPCSPAMSEYTGTQRRQHEYGMGMDPNMHPNMHPNGHYSHHTLRPDMGDPRRSGRHGSRPRSNSTTGNAMRAVSSSSSAAMHSDIPSDPPSSPPPTPPDGGSIKFAVNSRTSPAPGQLEQQTPEGNVPGGLPAEFWDYTEPFLNPAIAAEHGSAVALAHKSAEVPLGTVLRTRQLFEEQRKQEEQRMHEEQRMREEQRMHEEQRTQEGSPLAQEVNDIAELPATELAELPATPLKLDQGHERSETQVSVETSQSLTVALKNSAEEAKAADESGLDETETTDEMVQMINSLTDRSMNNNTGRSANTAEKDHDLTRSCVSDSYARRTAATLSASRTSNQERPRSCVEPTELSQYRMNAKSRPSSTGADTFPGARTNGSQSLTEPALASPETTSTFGFGLASTPSSSFRPLSQTEEPSQSASEFARKFSLRLSGPKGKGIQVRPEPQEDAARGSPTPRASISSYGTAPSRSVTSGALSAGTQVSKDELSNRRDTVGRSMQTLDPSDSSQDSTDTVRGVAGPSSKGKGKKAVLSYPPSQLPGLKDASNEQSLRKQLDKEDVTFRPSTSMSDPDAAVMQRAREVKMMTLEEARAIPSLNFSANDLIKKMNESMKRRAASRASLSSLGGLLAVDDTLDDHTCESRERYRSVFGGLDTNNFALDSTPSQIVSNGVGRSLSMDAAGISTSSPSSTSRPMSPQHEELFSQLRDFSIPDVGDGIKKVLEECGLKMQGNQVVVDENSKKEGGHERRVTDARNLIEARAKTLNAARSSARLRPLPGQQSLVPIADALYEGLKAEICAEAAKRASMCGSKSDENENDASNSSGDTQYKSARTSSSSVGEGRDDDTTPTPGKLRPWSLEHSYPWEETQSVDITLRQPDDEALRSPTPMPRSHPSRQRAGSNASSHAGLPGHARGDSKSGNYHARRASRPSTSHDSASHKRKLSITRGVYSSLDKIGAHKRSDKHGLSGYDHSMGGNKLPTADEADEFGHNHHHGRPSRVTDRSGFAMGPHLFSGDEHNTTVDPGDRYPTTSLSTPLADLARFHPDADEYDADADLGPQSSQPSLLLGGGHGHHHGTLRINGGPAGRHFGSMRKRLSTLAATLRLRSPSAAGSSIGALNAAGVAPELYGGPSGGGGGGELGGSSSNNGSGSGSNDATTTLAAAAAAAYYRDHASGMSAAQYHRLHVKESLKQSWYRLIRLLNLHRERRGGDGDGQGGGEGASARSSARATTPSEDGSVMPPSVPRTVVVSRGE